VRHCHVLYVAVQFDFFHEKRISSRAIYRTLVRVLGYSAYEVKSYLYGSQSSFVGALSRLR
jgi:hypothetical protein